MEQEKIARINALAHKAKTEGLTPEEIRNGCSPEGVCSRFQEKPHQTAGRHHRGGARRQQA